MTTHDAQTPASKPSASVIIAAWRAEDMLDHALDSALAQSDVEIEAILIDDCSPDGTYARAETRAEADPRIRVGRNAVNKGPSGARNAALDMARHDWVAVLDVDDGMEPNRLRELIAFAEARDADVVLGSFWRVDAEGVRIDEAPFLPRTRYPAPVPIGVDRYVAENSSLNAPNLGYLKPVFRRAFLERTGVRYREALRNSEDFHIILDCMINEASVWVHPSPFYIYTVREGSISHRVNPDHLAALLAADAEFVNTHRGALSEEAIRLFELRDVVLSDLMVAERVLAGIKRGSPAQALRALAARPRAVARVAAQLGEGVRRRLS